ncbi:MAG: hypothetical protein KDH19_19895 [Geminicoccaceae bacterium]|nr:hypothetical protein [Geminicoccaceae bacterium]MCB2012933.1 hypothetical protein [Geminicoccaceae bacterium]
MASNKAGRGGAHLMYACYAISLFTGLPMFAGVIVAYFTRGGAAPLYKGHLHYGISTFWWSLLLVIAGLLLSVILIGYVLLGIAWLYMAWRTGRGWLRLIDERDAPGR